MNARLNNLGFTRESVSAAPSFMLIFPDLTDAECCRKSQTVNRGYSQILHASDLFEN